MYKTSLDRSNKGDRLSWRDICCAQWQSSTTSARPWCESTRMPRVMLGVSSALRSPPKLKRLLRQQALGQHHGSTRRSGDFDRQERA